MRFVDEVEAVKAAVDFRHYLNTWLEGRLGAPTSGGWYRWDGLCPFHDDKKPGSFFVNLEGRCFCCFSCGTRGDVLVMHQRLTNMGFNRCMKDLKARYMAEVYHA